MFGVKEATKEEGKGDVVEEALAEHLWQQQAWQTPGSKQPNEVQLIPRSPGESGEGQTGEHPPTHRHASGRAPGPCLTPNNISTTTSDHAHLHQAPGARSEPSMVSGKLLHGYKYSAKAQPMHRVQEEVGCKEVREKEVVKEVGEVEVSEEALAESPLNHL